MFWEVHPDGPHWSLRRTTAGRVVDAGRWAVLGFAITLVGGAVFFGIDWFGRSAVGVFVPPTFLLSVLAFAGFGGFFGFVARMLRFRHWVVDRDGRTLGLSFRRAFADPEVEEVPLDDIRRIVVSLHDTGQLSTIVAEFTDGTPELLASSRWGSRAFDGVVLGLRRAFDETGVDVDVSGEE